MKNKLSLLVIVVGLVVTALVLSPIAGEAENKKYMVLYVEVDSGEVVEVFESREVGKVDKSAEQLKPPFNIKGFVSDQAIGTFYSKSSPG